MCPALKKRVHRLFRARTAEARRCLVRFTSRSRIACCALGSAGSHPCRSELLQCPHTEHLVLEEDVKEDAVHFIPKTLQHLVGLFDDVVDIGRSEAVLVPSGLQAAVVPSVYRWRPPPAIRDAFSPYTHPNRR